MNHYLSIKIIKFVCENLSGAETPQMGVTVNVSFLYLLYLSQKQELAEKTQKLNSLVSAIKSQCYGGGVTSNSFDAYALGDLNQLKACVSR